MWANVSLFLLCFRVGTDTTTVSESPDSEQNEDYDKNGQDDRNGFHSTIECTLGTFDRIDWKVFH